MYEKKRSHYQLIVAPFVLLALPSSRRCVGRPRPHVIARVPIREPTAWVQRYRFYLATAEVQHGIVRPAAVEPDIDRPRNYRGVRVCHFRILHRADRRTSRRELHLQNYWRWHRAVLTDYNRCSRTSRLDTRDRSVDRFGREQPVVPEPAEILVQRVVHEERVIPRRGMLEAPCLCVITHRVPYRGITDDAAEHG